MLRRLGHGGMGSVYLAERDGVLAAVKTVNPWLAHDSEFRSRFRREVTISARVTGPQVAEVLGSDIDAHIPWLALRFVPGRTLSQVIQTDGPLVGGELRALASGLLEGLLLIHAVGITHRDLKPANVIWHDHAPVIIDFGISRSVEGTVITSTAQAVGSPGWMSPEQILGQPPRPSSDAFSWAAVVAFAATGRAPFGTGAVEALTYRVIHTEPDLAGVDHELLPILGAAFRKDPVTRPDPATLLSALAGHHRFELEPPTLPAPAPAPAPAAATVINPPAPPRRRVGLWAAMIVIAALLGMTAAALIVLPGRDDPDPVAQDSGATLATPTSTGTGSGSTTETTTTSPPAASTSTTSEVEEIPAFRERIDPFTDNVIELFEFISAHQQSVVNLDVAFVAPANDGDSDGVAYSAATDPATVFVQSGPGHPACAGCAGLDIVIHDLATTPDAYLGWTRGTVQLTGRFAVVGLGGIHQGYQSFGLRAIPIS